MVAHVARRCDAETKPAYLENSNAKNTPLYERHGFRAIHFTDGRDNEERTPDVRYRWQR